MTEPGAGTDAQGQQTTAVLDESGENYILNGSKCFITNGNVADTCVVIAVTGKTVDKRGRSMKEISAFIVEKDDKGFSQGKQRSWGTWPGIWPRRPRRWTLIWRTSSGPTWRSWSAGIRT